VTVNFAGAIGSLSRTFFLTRTGSDVTCEFPGVTGACVLTQSSIDSAAGAIPARFRPNSTQRVLIGGSAGGVPVNQPVNVDFETGGTIRIYRDQIGTTWTNGKFAQEFTLLGS
jgi:hypothetical protein